MQRLISSANSPVRFYFAMSLIIAGVVAFGFGHTIDRNLIHAAVARPPLLYVHVAVFSGWVIFFIFQTALVQTRNVSLHRRLGWAGAVLGLALPILGISTSLTMARFNAEHFRAMRTASDLVVQFFDMISFTVPFALGIVWRKKIERHRRLIFIASCALTSAAFGRISFIPANLFYAGVDLLIFCGVVRDAVVNRRVHDVYIYTLPALLIGQVLTMTISAHL